MPSGWAARSPQRNLGMLGVNSVAELGPQQLMRVAGVRGPTDPV